MESNVISMATSIPAAVTESRSGIQLVHLSVGLLYPVALQTSVLGRKESCFYAMNKSSGGCKWLDQRKELCSECNRTPSLP